MRIIFPFVALLICTPLHAEDWPQFVGPRRDGTSKETVAPWKGEPKVVWRTLVGEGHSSPVVAEGLVFLHDNINGKNIERLTAFNASDGKSLAAVESERGEFSSRFSVGPRATPTVAGNHVYTFGVTGRLSASKFPRGDAVIGLSEVFGHDLLAEYQAKNLTFGVSASPLVDGDLVIVPVGGKGAGVVAYDRFTGKLAWKALDDAASYASPTTIGEGPKRQIVVLTQKGLASLSPRDGSINWQYPFEDKIKESSTTPIRAGDLLIASSVTLGSVALKLTERGGKPGVEEAWKRRELNCYFSTPVMVGKDHLYMVTGALTLPTSISLRCVEVSTGKTLWTKAKIGKYHAALIKTADDKLLMLDDSGHLTLIEPNPKEYRPLARSQVCGETWAHPALAGGRLYLRDAKELICLELK